MPLFSKRKSHSTGTDFKARLEHKLYLARENPEPAFDISACDLKNVPPGIFSLCKVFRKDALYLQENHLSSLIGGGNMKDLALLQVLDLNSNLLSSLPDDIQYLTNLRVLNLRHNQLKQLPNTIGHLVKLQVLDVSNNILKSITSALGQLHQLCQLDLRGNRQLSSLPSNLCHALNLKEIHVDGETLTHPPPNIVAQGTEAILQFLAEESGLDYTALRSGENISSPVLDNGATHLQGIDFQAKIMQLERLKEIKQQGMLALEQDMEEQQRKEFELQCSMKRSKEQLLDDLMVHQCKMESSILRVHQDHEAERLRLIENLMQEEKSSDAIISQLLALKGGTLQDSASIQQLLQLERLEEEELLNTRQREYESLRRKDVLNAMESLLEEEYRREEKLREYEEGRAVATRTLLSREIDNDKQLESLLARQDKAQIELIGQIQLNEELQRAAVGALLERGDARSWGLVQQVSLVEQQLAALTTTEMQRRKLQLSEQVSDLCDKRIALSELLVDLLAQQAKRRQQLLRTMEEMDRRRWTKDEDQLDDHDFWLHQYQRLLDSRPGEMIEMEKCLDPLLAQHFILAGVIHCLPFLGQWLRSADSLSSLTDFKLQDLGVNLERDRVAILEAISQYSTELAQYDIKLHSEPSAPLPEDKIPAPSSSPVSQRYNSNITTAECVVCMELQCEVIFVPCGHMCCCIKCAEILMSCPMCRAEVDQKIRVILP